MLNWLRNKGKAFSPTEHGMNGVYRNWGDPRPLLPQLKEMKKAVDCGSAAPAEYYRLLDKVCGMTLKPVGPEYEAHILPPDYLEFKSKYEKEGPYTFNKLM